MVSAIHNYTTRLMDSSLTRRDNQDAAKFLVHFIGDIHQPLHAEDVAKGGNEIHVVFRGAELKLHHVWDTSIAEAWIGGVRGKPFDEARKWATTLVGEIKRGKFRSQAQDWGNGINLGDPTATALLWARQSNAYVCSTGGYLSGYGIMSRRMGVSLRYSIMPRRTGMFFPIQY